MSDDAAEPKESPSACGQDDGPKDGESGIDTPLPDVPEVSKAASSDVEISSTAVSDCRNLPDAHATFRTCVEASRSLKEAREQKTAHCSCLETYVRTLRKTLTTKVGGRDVLNDGACGPRVRRTYYQTNASIGVVCPNSKDFDGSGAPCGMPGQKIFDARLIPNWVGVESKGYLLESFGITYRLGSIVLGIISLIILVVCGLIIFMKMRKPNAPQLTNFGRAQSYPAPQQTPVALVAPAAPKVGV